MRRPALVLGFALVAAACTSTSAPSEPNTLASPPTTASSSPLPTSTTASTDPPTLAAGVFDVAAAAAFGDPGFHEVTELTATLPGTIPDGTTLVVRLFDAARPGQTCDSDHPLSGCVTIDWSDFEDRPGVPPGGVFDNHITLQAVSGPITLFLSETGALAPVSDAYSPG